MILQVKKFTVSCRFVIVPFSLVWNQATYVTNTKIVITLTYNITHVLYPVPPGLYITLEAKEWARPIARVSMKHTGIVASARDKVRHHSHDKITFKIDKHYMCDLWHRCDQEIICLLLLTTTRFLQNKDPWWSTRREGTSPLYTTTESFCEQPVLEVKVFSILWTFIIKVYYQPPFF